MKQRKAIKRAAEIVAECPIDSTCTSKIDGKKDWQRCGYYDGTVQDRNGLRVVCKFKEQ